MDNISVFFPNILSTSFKCQACDYPHSQLICTVQTAYCFPIFYGFAFYIYDYKKFQISKCSRFFPGNDIVRFNTGGHLGQQKY